MPCLLTDTKPESRVAGVLCRYLCDAISIDSRCPSGLVATCLSHGSFSTVPVIAHMPALMSKPKPLILTHSLCPVLPLGLELKSSVDPSITLSDGA